MHHKTTLNLPTLSSKERDRAWLAERLAAAGAVPVDAAPIEPRPMLNGHWSNERMTITKGGRQVNAAKPKAPCKKGRPTGATAPDSPSLIERARAMAAIGLTRFATARKLEIGTERLERMCRQYGIQFATNPKKAA